MNLDECESIKANWIALYGNGDNETYLNNFGVKHILKKF